MSNRKQLVINYEKLETRVALLNNGRLDEYQIERDHSHEPRVNSVYLARIVNLEPNMQAAFVDIGGAKNALLHYWDMLPATEGMSDSIERNEKPTNTKSGPAARLKAMLRGSGKSNKIRENEKKRRNKKITVKDIPKIFPAGTELLVQVTKGPIGSKGARVTTNISIPGRYLVLLPYADHIGLSSKIENRKERQRLRKILKDLDLPEGMGMICRTVGEGRRAVYFKRDLEMLLDFWHKVETALERPRVPLEVYSEPTLVERTIRDFLTEDIGEIVVDGADAYKDIRGSLKKFAGSRSAAGVKHYNRSVPIFEFYRVKDQVADIFDREVSLPGGGWICIDETEAMITIDINTGRGRRDKDQAEAIFNTNMEAAEEVARQLRLRNIGGLVVIDFIDMRNAAHREKVYKTMLKLVKEDRAKSRLLPISRLGLMEMTRQREHESLQDAYHDPCPYCEGTGRVKTAFSMSVEIQRRLNQVLRANYRDRSLSIRVIVHPQVMARLKNQDVRLLDELENKYGKNLTFRADPALHHEQFKLVDPETNTEL
jgi:Rne/Rng family ribonuclease